MTKSVILEIGTICLLRLFHKKITTSCQAVTSRICCLRINHNALVYTQRYLMFISWCSRVYLGHLLTHNLHFKPFKLRSDYSTQKVKRLDVKNSPPIHFGFSVCRNQKSTKIPKQYIAYQSLITGRRGVIRSWCASNLWSWTSKSQKTASYGS